MKIIDGIAYADNLEKHIHIVGVQPFEDYTLIVRFSTGEVKSFNCAHLLDTPAFSKLKDKNIFKSVYIDYGVPTWLDGEVDICADTLYSQGLNAVYEPVRELA